MQQHATPCQFNTSASWVILNPIEQGIKAKIEKIGVPLKDWDISINYGIKTGFNDAFIISEQKREEILTNCATDDERKRTDELIRPILRGRDIKRYGYNWAGLYLIATHNGIPEKGIPNIDIKKYPAVKAHLDSHWEQIENRSDQGDTPYHLRSCAYMEITSRHEINSVRTNKFSSCIEEKIWFVGNVSPHDFRFRKIVEFLICFLNSPLSEYLFSKIGSSTGVGTTRCQSFTLEQLFVPRIATSTEKEWETLLVRLQNSEIINADINRRIYTLCGLSAEEIVFVERYSESI